MPLLNGAVLREARLRKGLKKSELAALCRVTYRHLDNVEHRRKNASIELTYRLAAALDREVADLLRAEDDDEDKHRDGEAAA